MFIVARDQIKDRVRFDAIDLGDAMQRRPSRSARLFRALVTMTVRRAPESW
jgi:hypothetical protein